jgi:hypothetical protein
LILYKFEKATKNILKVIIEKEKSP